MELNRILIGWKSEVNYLKKHWIRNVKEDLLYSNKKFINGFCESFLFIASIFQIILQRFLYEPILSWFLILLIAPFIKDMDKIKNGKTK